LLQLLVQVLAGLEGAVEPGQQVFLVALVGAQPQALGYQLGLQQPDPGLLQGVLRRQRVLQGGVPALVQASHQPQAQQHQQAHGQQRSL
jgi:hypothetical protein